MVLSYFTAYNIRNKFGIELNDDIAYRVGRVNAQYPGAYHIAVASDVRQTSKPPKRALVHSLIDSDV